MTEGGLDEEEDIRNRVTYRWTKTSAFRSVIDSGGRRRETCRFGHGSTQIRRRRRRVLGQE